jgi:RNA recognition motif-containing protein
LKKLYVGNLPFQVDSSDLEQLFSEFGEVQSAQVVQDRETGRSRGFGFVEMAGAADAQAAIDGLHDREYQGRRLTVNEARPREARVGAGYGAGASRSRSGGYGGGGYGGRGRSGGYGGRY